MGRRTILLDTLTRHFITFAKTMGFFPKIVSRFKERAKWEELDFYEKGSFYEYIRRGLECRGYTSRVLNEYSIRSIYFDDLLPPSKSNYKKYIDSVNKSEMLLELFMSYLKDKKIPRYIKIIIN